MGPKVKMVLYLTEKLEKKPVWITNQYSRQLVHKWRTEEQAILVGTQAAVMTTQTKCDWSGKNPIRLVIDKTIALEKNNHMLIIKL